MGIQAGSLEANIFQAIIVIIILIVSLSIHEFAHAFVANLFGDPTAKLEGRLTLNPIKHWDPVGTTMLTILLFTTLVVTRVPVFGWGKPVPVDERNFENPKLHGIQTALAGPMSNLIVAGLLALLLRTVDLNEIVSEFVRIAIYLNLFLMFFNMLPIPPLDGSRLLRLFLPENVYFNIATNPLIFIPLFVITIFFLLNYVVIFSTNLTNFFVG